MNQAIQFTKPECQNCKKNLATEEILMKDKIFHVCYNCKVMFENLKDKLGL